jgi:hypothetical protein
LNNQSKLREHLMNAPLTIALAASLVCGCSRTPAASARLLLAALQPGKEVQVDNYRLRIEKREGNSVMGIQVLETEPDGPTTKLTADKGTLEQGTNRLAVTLVLHGVHFEKGKQKGTADEVSIDLSAR